METLNIKKFFWEAVKHHFLIFLILLILSLIWGSFLFYKNFILIKKMEPEIVPHQIQIEKEILQEILKTLENREEKLKEIVSKIYLNPFEEAALTNEEEGGEEER